MVEAESRTGPLPTFLYIGASKSGSSWMFEILREHPDVFVPVAKDIFYFDRHFDRSEDWYRSFFAPAGEAKAVGELCHDYFLREDVADRIQERLPGVKLFASLREPVAKLVSMFYFFRATRLPPEVTFAEFTSRPEILAQCDYLGNLTPYFERFPRENVSVFFFDELKADAADLARRVFAFIGVDPDFEPAAVGKRVLGARRPRSFLVALLAYRTAQVLRRLGGANLVGRVKRHPLFERILYDRLRDRPEVDLETRVRLHERFVDSFDALGELIGRPVPRAWYDPPTETP